MIVETAPAKVNLFLHINGRTDKGYHLLESLFVFTKGGDTVRFTPREDEEEGQVSLSVSGPFEQQLFSLGGGGEDNLVIGAAQLVAGFAVDQGLWPLQSVHIHLEKNLPVAAGIGGGSADAAAALRGLKKFWQLDIDDQQLHKMALSLGADVPACLAGTPQWVTGIGDQLQTVTLGYDPVILLVNPGISTDTPMIFKEFKASGVDFDVPLTDKTVCLSTIESLKNSSHNSLTATAMIQRPIIQELLSVLGRCEGADLVRMSGSGATCFALFQTEDQARDAVDFIQKHHPAWWTHIDRLQL